MTAKRLELHELHRFHLGLSVNTSDYYTAAAVACLSRHHTSPTDFEVSVDGGARGDYETHWSEPEPRDERHFRNEDDATRDGAYCIAWAAAHAHLDLVMHSRAPGRGTGVDWYMVPADAEPDLYDYDLDRADIVRLEVSGIDRDTDARMHGRMREKIKQARAGNSPFETYASVVGFLHARVQFARVLK